MQDNLKFWALPFSRIILIFCLLVGLFQEATHPTLIQLEV